MPDRNRRLRARLVWSTALAVGAVLSATFLVPSWGGNGAEDSQPLIDAYERATKSRQHQHQVEATQNAISRGGEPAGTEDTTTSREQARSEAAVEAQRNEPDPALVRVPAPADRSAVPPDRYAMAGGCYALQGPDGRWLVRSGNGYATTGATRASAEPLHFQATDLGSYLLWDSEQEFVAGDGNLLIPSVTSATEANARAVWAVKKSGATFTFGNDAGNLHSGDPVSFGMPSGFRPRLTDGCATWPEITDNVGRTFAGVSSFQEVRGTTDAHTHGMAFEFLGGGAHCGRPWSPFGVEVALQDCPDHSTTQGQGAILEAFLSGRPSHDPVGWPTFEDWPAPDSLTHEGTYYKWMERAWKGGLRIFVNLLVENNQLCMIYPIKGEVFAETQCDDMKSAKQQADDMRAFERYIDAQYGGPGKGWYRIVTDPFEARKVINSGKLAVVMGIETSVPFGCSTVVDQPECSAAKIDQQLDEAYSWGVRQMELVNKFDNALAGVAGDSGAIGPLVNGANFLETQSFWDMRTCPTSYGEDVQDNDQPAAPGAVDAEQQDALFGAVADLFGVAAAPIYASPTPHCNRRSLTTLGEHTIRGMAQRRMIFDPDHMSVRARKSSLDLLEELRYPGVISSHSWSTPDAYPRIYKLGGAVFPYAGDSGGFVEKWEQHVKWADPRFYFGFGYGADINGLGAQGDPRGADADNPVTYPFTGMGGVRVDQQVSGERVYDINLDGVAHYGLYPDWLEDLEKQAGPDITTDMSRGAEAYLQMWERTVGVSNDACRQPSVAKPASMIRNLARGMTVRQVLLRAGQPHERLGRELTYCARTASGSLTEVTKRFTADGRLV